MKALQRPECRMLVFVFTNDRDVTVPHNRNLDLDSATDIMPFLSLESDPATPDATIEAEAGWSPLDELRFPAIHVMLHLAGRDDQDAWQCLAMLERQVALHNSWRSNKFVDADDTTPAHLRAAASVRQRGVVSTCPQREDSSGAGPLEGWLEAKAPAAA